MWAGYLRSLREAGEGYEGESMKRFDGAVRLGRGEPCWNAEGSTLSLIRYEKRRGLVGASIRPKSGFKGRGEFIIYAVPVERKP